MNRVFYEQGVLLSEIRKINLKFIFHVFLIRTLRRLSKTMKKQLLIFSLFLLIAGGVSSQNLQIRSNLTFPYGLANIGGYVDTAGNEYALVGTDEGLSIVNVTDPDNPFIRFDVPGVQNAWREVKTYRKYAYVTNEGGNGLQIIDMSRLPDTIRYKNYRGDGIIANQLNTIHALHCDTATGFLYLYGTDLSNGSTLFLDLSDPWNPTYAGNYVYPGGASNAYVHDGYASNDTLYEAHIYAGFFAIVDVRNKSNPVLLATQETPTAFTHNTWLSDDHRTLFTTDENANSYLGAYDISDVTNIRELSRYQTTPGSGSVVHNTHILNDYAITSWYKDGVVITDVSRPANPVEVARYDTYPQGTGNGFSGCWGVYPYLPSGTIVASDINNGLFVLTPSYERGCYLEGIISDSITGIPIFNAQVQLLSTSITKTTDGIGEYRIGLMQAGTYDIRVSAAGYITKTVSGLQLSNGVLTLENVQLAQVQTFAYTGLVSDSATGLPVSNASVSVIGNGLNYRVTSDSNGLFSLNAVPDNYTIYAGKWGYRTVCQPVSLGQGGQNIPVTIAPGYYDDFTFNYGWTVSGSSPNAWERGEPIGTTDNNGTEVNPEFDVTSDCSDTCFVTDNGGAPHNSSDVDNGNTIITSPVFDGTIYQNPVMSYYRRFLDIAGLGTPNDTMKIRVSNGITTAVVENVLANASGNGNWVYHSVNLASIISLTNNMRLTVEVADVAPGNICEGAFDQFQITGQLINNVPEISPIRSFSAFPNPFSGEITITYLLESYDGLAEISLSDLSGRSIEKITPEASEGSVRFGQKLAAGVYFVTLSANGVNQTIRVVKY